jgi:hypothetical protein
VDGSYAPVSSTTRNPRLAAHHAVVGLGGADFGFARLYGLQREGRVLKLLRSEGMPVPEVIAACENPNVVVMEHVDGLSDFTLIESAEERDQIARQFAAIMGKVARNSSPEVSRDRLCYAKYTRRLHRQGPGGLGAAALSTAEGAGAAGHVCLRLAAPQCSATAGTPCARSGRHRAGALHLQGVARPGGDRLGTGEPGRPDA